MIVRRALVITVCLLAALTGLRFCGDQDGREARQTRPRAARVITPEQLLHLAEYDDQPLRLRATRDEIPGGLSAAMAPLLIDWEASDPDRADGFVVVHNLNYGGNPTEGTTVLQTVKVPLDGVESIEWILVPLGAGLHHGQLRFVFRQDRPVELLDLTPAVGGGDAHLHDLVFSWEAWRAPGVDYDARKGMDPENYALSLRLYAGPQRFLEDALGQRDWFSTTLRIPGGDEGRAEVLRVTLVLGDGIARHTISEQLAGSVDDWLTQAPVTDRDALSAQWRELQDLAAPRTTTDDLRLNPPSAERTYQTVLRSCASVAYYSVLVAVERLAERGLTDGVDFDHLDRAHLGGDEPWMRQIAAANLGGLFLRAPLALRWLRDHPYALPSKIPARLDGAGLVERRGAERLEFHYSLAGVTPYGTLAENLIR